MVVFGIDLTLAQPVSGLLMCLSISIAVAQQPEALKASGDSAYVSGQYDAAIERYEQVLGQGFESAEVYFNLGNAYFKTNRIAPSILNYERALKQAPQDEDIRFNLKLAQMTTKDRIDPIPQLFFIEWWVAARQSLSMDGWAWVTLVAFALTFLALGVFRFSANEGLRRILFYSAVVLVLVGIFSGYAAQQQYNRLLHGDRAVVFQATLNVKSAPEQTGKDLFVIHEGLTVRITEQIGDWYRIRLTDGNVGWVPKGTVSRI